MDSKRPLDDAELDQLFSAVRTTPEKPSEDLMARIMADATSEITLAKVPVRAPISPLRALLDFVGGWPSVAGLATATVAGLVIGLSTPDTFETLTNGAFATTTSLEIEDLLPSFDDILGEG